MGLGELWQSVTKLLLDGRFQLERIAKRDFGSCFLLFTALPASSSVERRIQDVCGMELRATFRVASS